MIVVCPRSHSTLLLSFNHDAPTSGHWVFNWPTSAPALLHIEVRWVGLSVGRSFGTPSLCDAAQSSTMEELLPRRPGQPALDIAGLYHKSHTPCPSMPLHVPHGHVVLCALLAPVGAGWFKCAQITGQGSKYSQQASPRSPLQQGPGPALPKPPRNPPVLPPFKHVLQLVPAHVVLQIQV